MQSNNENIEFSELIGKEILFTSADKNQIAILKAFSADSHLAVISLGDDELEVELGEIDHDLEQVDILKSEMNKNSVITELARIRSLSPEEIKEEISNAGHVNEILNFSEPESITINDFNNLSQLIPSEPNHKVILALKERHKWDEDRNYTVDVGQHIVHVNVIAAIAYPEAFFDLREDEGAEV